MTAACTCLPSGPAVVAKWHSASAHGDVRVRTGDGSSPRNH